MARMLRRLHERSKNSSSYVMNLPCLQNSNRSYKILNQTRSVVSEVSSMNSRKPGLNGFSEIDLIVL